MSVQDKCIVCLLDEAPQQLCVNLLLQDDAIAI